MAKKKVKKETKDLKEAIDQIRQRFGDGAIASRVFVGYELASIGWIALNEKAQRMIFNVPLKIDYANKEAFHGGIWTNPKYRRKGLIVYTAYKRLQYLYQLGITRVHGTSLKSNIVIKRQDMKLQQFDYKKYAEARYFINLWWKSWKERPLKHDK